MRAGLIFSFRRLLGDSLPSHISVRTSPEQRITFSRVAEGWSAAAEPIRWQTQESRIEGVIDNSLYEALDAGVSDDQLDAGNRRRLAWALADVYAWQVDFTRDIQPGDRFVRVTDTAGTEVAACAVIAQGSMTATISPRSAASPRSQAGELGNADICIG